VVSNLSPRNRTLRDMYNPIVRELVEREGRVPAEILERRGAVAADSEVFKALIRDVRLRRDRSLGHV